MFTSKKPNLGEFEPSRWEKENIYISKMFWASWMFIHNSQPTSPLTNFTSLASWGQQSIAPTGAFADSWGYFMSRELPTRPRS